MSKHIILTGFMGAGKSTVGPRVAAELEVPWYDTDRRVTELTDRTPDFLIRNCGMPKFRAIELRALEAVLAERAGVVSTGGGIISTRLGRRALREATADVYFLDAPFDLLVERCKADEGNARPLLDNTAQAKNTFEARKPWYADTADRVIDATRPVTEVVEEIVESERRFA